MTPHPRSLELDERMKRLIANAAPWSGVAFRASAERYANRDDLLTGAGSRRAGGRWNPRDLFHAVYLSVGIDTAVAELLGQYTHYGLEAAGVTPFVVVGVEVKLAKVLDLTVAATRKTLGLTLTEILDPGWSAAQDAGEEALPQAIGRIAFEAELDGLLVPSASRRGETNVVAFPGNVVPPEAYLRSMNRDKLPLPRRR